MSTDDDGNVQGGLEEIDESECWRLLASQPVGRFAINVGSYPMVVPVNHAVVAHGVVFRTAPGSKLWALRRSNVSFEVDALDQNSQTGWSVLLRGSASEVTSDSVNPELAEAARAEAPDSWVPGERQHLVRIVADSISGRRIRRPESRSLDRTFGSDCYPGSARQ